MKKPLLVLFTLIASCSLIAFGGAARAAAPQYPTKPVNLIVPNSPGGGSDTAARALASIAPKYLGQSLIVINKPGGSGSTAHSEIAKAKPDGYTLLITGNSPSTVVPYLGKVNYDPLNDFEFIIRITNLRNSLGVAGNSQFKTVEEFFAYAKANPGKIKIGNSGANGIDDLVIRMMNAKVGMQTVQVPFDSSAEIIAAVMGGHIAAYSGSVTSILPMVQNKTMRILAITADERDPVFPDIQTLKEKGMDVSLNNQIGVGAPKGTPKEIIAFLHDAFKKSLDDEGFRAFAKRLNFSIDYLNPADFKQAVEADSNKVKAIIAAGAK
jgi:tripartite-type tricarboxylate transporter receptor subunit TctC